MGQSLLQNAGSVLKVLIGFEEWNDVDDGCVLLPAQSLGGEIIDICEVLRRLCEGDDVATRCVGAVPALHGCHRTEGLKDLLARHRHALLRVRILEPPEGLAVDCRVLTDLQLGQVEAERLDLPDELLEVAVGGPLRPASTSDSCTQRRSSMSRAGTS